MILSMKSILSILQTKCNIFYKNHLHCQKDIFLSISRKSVQNSKKINLGYKEKIQVIWHNQVYFSSSNVSRILRESLFFWKPSFLYCSSHCFIPPSGTDNFLKRGIFKNNSHSMAIL